MNTLQSHGRRLYPRFQIDKVDAHLRYSNGTEDETQSAVKILEIAKDGMTCQIKSDEALSPGMKVSLLLSELKSKKLLKGKIASASVANGSSRLGLLFPGEDVFTLFGNSNFPPSDDQRKGPRREENLSNTGKREFDRRGLWRGLLSQEKRYFSHYIWGLQNRDEYFFMKPLQSSTGPHVIVDSREMVMMSSNNYLSLTNHPKVLESATAALKKYGSGACASAVLGGMFDIHFQLEEALAKFEDVEAVCLFSSGYVANLTTLMTILRKNDAVFNDQLNHASLLDGSRLSGADFNPFRHRDIKDLDIKLSRSTATHNLVVIDGVFSMDGDIAPLPDIFRLCRKNGAALMVDEAHATGVFGEKGRGLLEHFGMQGKADVVIGTMSKSLCASGGFIGGNKELIKILKHSSRGAIFSANISPVTCAIVLAALKIIDEEPERRKNLWRNAYQLCSGLQSLGFNTGDTQSPIIPVIFPEESHTHLAIRCLREHGVFACPVVFPAVKKNQSRVRLTVTADHSEGDIVKVLNIFKKIKLDIEKLG